MFTVTPLAIADVLYPPSLNGTWLCQRVVTSVEGDQAQAEGAWRLLGGTGSIRGVEQYIVRYVGQPGTGVDDNGRMTGAASSLQSIEGIDGKRYFGVVLDRGYEMASRMHGANVSWDVASAETLRYERDADGPGAAAELRVMQRSVEPPSDKGWGSNELVRITTSASTLFTASFDITYAARVQRRFRRSFTDTGERVVEGLEIVKTYRVLDGVAGVEMPTSTTRSTLRLTRPPS